MYYKVAIMCDYNLIEEKSQFYKHRTSETFNPLEKPLYPESVLDSQYLRIRVLRVLRVLRDSDNSTIEWLCIEHSGQGDLVFGFEFGFRL